LGKTLDGGVCLKETEISSEKQAVGVRDVPEG
jgi:hypothetical protein